MLSMKKDNTVLVHNSHVQEKKNKPNTLSSILHAPALKKLLDLAFTYFFTPFGSILHVACMLDLDFTYFFSFQKINNHFSYYLSGRKNHSDQPSVFILEYCSKAAKAHKIKQARRRQANGLFGSTLTHQKLASQFPSSTRPKKNFQLYSTNSRKIWSCFCTCLVEYKNLV